VRQGAAIVANGFADGPAQALRDYLVGKGTRVVAISHPLTPENGRGHVIAEYAAGKRIHEHTIRLPVRPPASFLFDAFVPLAPPPVDAWFGFNPLASARGLVARRRDRARFVVLWSVDFVPDRFGRGTPATRVYDRIDRLCCTHVDARIELSEAAREGRNRRHGLAPDAPAAHVVPMGAWLDRVPIIPPDGFRRRRVVFLGHLVERQGVETFLESLALLVRRGETIQGDVIGTGPLEEALRERAKRLGLERAVRFHGFVSDHRDVERLLANASLGVAPYRPGDATFTRYADPGKLKAYLAAGLPIVLTDVPPNARELEREAGAEIVPFEPAAFAAAVARSHENAGDWVARRDAALAYARRFDWGVLLPEALRKLGLDAVPA
jgi:glycosyltransferase involved in cell wall biosynthesis